MSATTSAPHHDLPAREVDRRLRAAVALCRRAERQAVLWFEEVLSRKLYRDLGFGSIQQYAAVALGFSPAKTAQFVRLAGALGEMPRLRESVARGEVTWTQARTVAGVATVETERAWVRAAKGATSRDLEAQVRLARRQAQAARGGRGQEALGLVKGDGTQGKGHPPPPGGDAQKAGSGNGKEHPPPLPPVGSLPLPRNVHLRFSPEQGARYEALLEALRKQGASGDKAELLLAGLEALVLGQGARGAAATGRETKRVAGGELRGAGASSGDRVREAFASPYQVLVHLCPSCSGGSVVTGRGAEPLEPRELRAILCDARVRQPGKRNRAMIPARVRREVLERDGHRCRSAGCGSVRFLAVHHLTPREAGGTNEPGNLLTLCSACHRAIHGHAGRGRRCSRVSPGAPPRPPRPEDPG